MSKEENIIGRDYEIDYLDAASDMLDSEEILGQEMSAGDKLAGKFANVEGFVDYCIGRWRGRNSIYFKDIPKLLQNTGTRGCSTRLGILFLYDYSMGFDFITESQVLIPRGTKVGEIEVPRVIFSTKTNEVVTAKMIDKSFDILAQHILRHDLKMQYLLGLTHPRLGSLISKKWGFGLEKHPFPEEVYKLIDLSLGNEQIEDAENLQAVRQQVLVYQPLEVFRRS